MIKLKTHEIKTLVAVHGWAGALLGLLLYAVIVTGTAAVFANEIKAWSGGLLGTSEPLARPLNALVERLEAETPEEFREDLSLRATPAGNLWAFFHRDEKVDGVPKERGILYTIAPDGRIIARAEGYGDEIAAADPFTALGRFYVDLHVRLHIPNPWGLVLTGILGLAMLVAAVSGIMMHRHLFTDIFTLRGRYRLVGLRDLHSVAGTWTLPHAFVLAFTGAYLSFAIAVCWAASPASRPPSPRCDRDRCLRPAHSRSPPNDARRLAGPRLRTSQRSRRGNPRCDRSEATA